MDPLPGPGPGGTTSGILDEEEDEAEEGFRGGKGGGGDVVSLTGVVSKGDEL